MFRITKKHRQSPDIVSKSDKRGPVGVAGVVLAALAVPAAREAAVARLPVDAGGEQEAGVGEDLGGGVGQLGAETAPLRHCTAPLRHLAFPDLTSAAGLCQVKSVQSSVRSQTAWHSWGQCSVVSRRCGSTR
jgi:hypothetical protein